MRGWTNLETLRVEMPEDNVSYDLNKRFWTQLIYGLTPFSSQRVQGSSLSSIILPTLSRLQLGSNEEDDWYDEKYDLTDFPNATSALVALVSSRAAALRGRGRTSIIEAASGLLKVIGARKTWVAPHDFRHFKFTLHSQEMKFHWSGSS